VAILEHADKIIQVLPSRLWNPL